MKKYPSIIPDIFLYNFSQPPCPHWSAVVRRDKVLLLIKTYAE